MKRKTLATGILLLFLVGILSPLSMGIQANLNEKSEVAFHHIDLPKSPYDYYNTSEIPLGFDDITNVYTNEEDSYYSATNTYLHPSQKMALMNSSWPMYCHDLLHSGRSPYDTMENTGVKLWKFNTLGWAVGGPTIDNNGTIYIGAYYLYAIYPNGTLKWMSTIAHNIVGAPAINQNGTIYVGSNYGDGKLYAYTPNGNLKWIYSADNDIFSSPSISSDGTIYFGSGGGYPPTGSIYAIHPNGTLRWKYNTGHVVYSSPAIGNDGTVYCGSHDTYLYALYPNNGALKWKFKTGDWIRVSPCIADDGTVYIVSLDSFLYAINPNGTLKWKTKVGGGTSPTIGYDGTIYCGWNHLQAINPLNGTVKWIFDVQGTIEGGTPCNSKEGTIYLGTSSGGSIIAIDSNGTEKWKRRIGNYVDSPPAINEDGTVYIGTSGVPGEGCLYAIGSGPLEVNAHGPYLGIINQSNQFTGTVYGGIPLYTFYWDFGEENTSYEQNPIHSYFKPGNYTVTFTVTDNTSNTSSDTTWAWIQDGNNPPTTPMINGRIKGNPGVSYEYTFESSDPEGTKIWYYINWGDDSNTGWMGPYSTGTMITRSHTWDEQDTYIIRCKTKDVYDDESDWGYLEVEVPYTYNYPGWQWFQTHFPLLSRLLDLLGGLE